MMRKRYRRKKIPNPQRKLLGSEEISAESNNKETEKSRLVLLYEVICQFLSQCARQSRAFFVQAGRRLAPYGRLASYLSAIISVIILTLPKITITTSLNPDINNAFGTLFSIKNEGHTPVFEADFSCRINSVGGNTTLENVGFINFSRRVTLWPGQVISRRCPLKISGSSVRSEIDVNVDFYIIPGSIQFHRSVHFSGGRGTNGYYLVPDAN